MTGYDLFGYGLVLVVWGISWMLLGSGLVYLLARYFARDEADAEAAEQSAAPAPVASATPSHPSKLAA
jgi:hypothetical protein